MAAKKKVKRSGRPSGSTSLLSVRQTLKTAQKAVDKAIETLEKYEARLAAGKGK